MAALNCIVHSAGATLQYSYPNSGGTASLLRPSARRSRLLFDVSFRLVCLGLLILQSLRGVGVRRGSCHFPILGSGIGSLWQPASSILFCQFLHAACDLLAEMVVHLLQIVERDRNLVPDRAIILLAGQHFYIEVVVFIRRIGNALDHIAFRERALIAVCHDRKFVMHDEHAPLRIECWRCATTRCLPVSVVST